MNEASVCSCGKPTRDAAYTCDSCLGDLTKALAEVTWLAGELETTIQRARGIDYSTLGGAPSNEKPMPYNVAAAERRRDLRNVLHTAVRFCTEEHVRHQSPSNRLPVDSLESMSRWLMWRVDGLGLSDMGYEFVRDITDAMKACRQAIDTRPERRYAGPCECGRDLYHKPGAIEAACVDCERVYQVAELYEWMRSQVTGRLVTAYEGSLLLSKYGLETSSNTISQWAKRKRIVSRGTGEKDWPLYLLDELFDLAAQRNVTQGG